MTFTALTKTERKILDALSRAPDKTVGWRELRDASGCRTAAGFRRVLNRMIGSTVARADQPGMDIVLTFHGMQAIQKASAE